jgi:hypothetical protein
MPTPNEHKTVLPPSSRLAGLWRTISRILTHADPMGRLLVSHDETAQRGGWYSGASQQVRQWEIVDGCRSIDMKLEFPTGGQAV